MRSGFNDRWRVDQPLNLPRVAAVGPAEIAQRRSQASPQQLSRLEVEHWTDGDSEPEFLAVRDAVNQFGSKQVIGFELDGVAYAFTETGMLRPSHSVVSFEAAQKRVTVAYCVHLDHARVLVASKPEQRKRIGIAGVAEFGELILTVDGKCFDLRHPDLPIPDISFTRMALENWYRFHPNSRLYLGGLLQS